MKNNVKPFLILGILVIISLSSTIYLHSQDFFVYEEVVPFAISENYISDNTYLPDVEFLKEVLKSLFNIIRIS